MKNLSYEWEFSPLKISVVVGALYFVVPPLLFLYPDWFPPVEDVGVDGVDSTLDGLMMDAGVDGPPYSDLMVSFTIVDVIEVMKRNIDVIQ